MFIDEEVINELTINYLGSPVKVSVEDMPNQLFKDIATLCGVNVAISLLKNFPGNTIFVPLKGFKFLERRIICDAYEKEFDAECIRRLSRKFCLSEKTVREILINRYKVLKVPGQMSLFDNTGNNQDKKNS